MKKTILIFQCRNAEISVETLYPEKRETGFENPKLKVNDHLSDFAGKHIIILDHNNIPECFEIIDTELKKINIEIQKNIEDSLKQALNKKNEELTLKKEIELGEFLQGQGSEEGALQLFKNTLASYPDMKPLLKITIHQKIGKIHIIRFEFEPAQQHYKQALEIAEEFFGPNHPNTGTSLSNLALLLTKMDRYEEAEPLSRRALKITEEVLGPTHPDTGTRLDNLALLLTKMDHYEEAELLSRRALKITEETLGPDHLETRTILSNIALLLTNMEQYEEAEPFSRRAAKIKEKPLSPIHSKITDGQPYNKSIFMTTHNSYRWSLIHQLDHGIRGFEFDVHDNWTLFERIKRFLTFLKIFRGKGSFKVGNWIPGHEVNHRATGNPRGNNLKDWLEVINNWSERYPHHAPITIFLDIKKNLIDANNIPSEQFGLIRLNEQIRIGMPRKEL